MKKTGKPLSASVEKLWVSLLNSDRWRRFVKSGVGAKVFRSRAFQRSNITRRYAITYCQGRLHPKQFEDVGTFCMFIGHTKSGGTMIGSLLDAHANVILADETDVLGYVSSGFNRDQIFRLLLKYSKRDALKGRVTARRLVPYHFSVPGQWQSRNQTLKVIGHSRAGPTTGKLSLEPSALEKLRNVMAGVNIKIIHTIRNPYDPISLMMVRGNRSFANAIDHYFVYCETLISLREQLDHSILRPVKYEEFVTNPREQLKGICTFLGIDADIGYLDACTSILYKFPDRSRHMVDWDETWIDVVQNKINQVDFLEGYTFSN
jgi:hypothetical protein